MLAVPAKLHSTPELSKKDLAILSTDSLSPYLRAHVSRKDRSSIDLGEDIYAYGYTSEASRFPNGHGVLTRTISKQLKPSTTEYPDLTVQQMQYRPEPGMSGGSVTKGTSSNSIYGVIRGYSRYRDVTQNRLIDRHGEFIPLDGNYKELSAVYENINLRSKIGNALSRTVIVATILSLASASFNATGFILTKSANENLVNISSHLFSSFLTCLILSLFSLFFFNWNQLEFNSLTRSTSLYRYILFFGQMILVGALIYELPATEARAIVATSAPFTIVFLLFVSKYRFDFPKLVAVLSLPILILIMFLFLSSQEFNFSYYTFFLVFGSIITWISYLYVESISTYTNISLDILFKMVFCMLAIFVFSMISSQKIDISYVLDFSGVLNGFRIFIVYAIVKQVVKIDSIALYDLSIGIGTLFVLTLEILMIERGFSKYDFIFLAALPLSIYMMKYVLRQEILTHVMSQSIR